MNARGLVAVLGCTMAVFVPAAARPPASPQASSFTGADACKECHADYYQAWSDTKHARAINRLGQSEREGGQCIRCHVTGTPEMIAAEGAKPSFPGVQCEACHGAGRAHVDSAKAGAAAKGAIAKKPDEAACTRCHTPESPHYKPFFYSALLSLVHRVKK